MIQDVSNIATVCGAELGTTSTTDGNEHRYIFTPAQLETYSMSWLIFAMFSDFDAWVKMTTEIQEAIAANDVSAQALEQLRVAVQTNPQTVLDIGVAAKVLHPETYEVLVGASYP